MQVWVQETTGDAVYYHRTADLSSGGLHLEGTMPHEPGTRVRLRFLLPGDEEPVEVAGEIVPPAAGRELGMGVRFVDPPEPVTRRIDAFVREAIGVPLER